MRMASQETELKAFEDVAESFMDMEVLPFANSNFANVQTLHFQNKVIIPSYKDLMKYWLSNI